MRSPTSKMASSTVRLSSLTNAAAIESYNLDIQKRKETSLALEKKIQSV